MFDLVLLGTGIDGHTASLFPNQTSISETDYAVPESNSPKLPKERISLSLSVLQKSNCLFIVTGIEKSQIIKTIFTTGRSLKLPAALVDAKWFVDRLAAIEIASNVIENKFVE